MHAINLDPVSTAAFFENVEVGFVGKCEGSKNGTGKTGGRAKEEAIDGNGNYKGDS